MVGGEVEVDVADRVVGTDQRDFLGLGQVAKIEKPEPAEGDQDADGARILSWIRLGSRLVVTVVVGRWLDARDDRDVLAVCCEDKGTETGDSNAAVSYTH